MIKEIYLGISEALADVDSDAGPIQHFDLWNQNVLFAAEDVFPTPAVFIEFDAINYKPIKEDKQLCTPTIRLHVVTDAVCKSNIGSATINDALAYLDLIDKIHAKLAKLEGGVFGNFFRVSSIPNHDHGELLESVEVYTCSAADLSAVV